MEPKTFKKVIDEILYELYGGLPPTDRAFSDRFIFGKINDGIASLAMIDAFQNTNIEGITFAGDAFFVSFREVALTDDVSTGYKVLTLPATPVGIPRGRDIEATPVGSGTNNRATMYKRLPRHEVQRMLSLPEVKKIFFYQEGSKLYFIVNKFFKNISLSAINLTMQCTGGEMTDVINLPAGYIDKLKEDILNDLRPALGTPKDIRNDGRQILEPRA